MLSSARCSVALRPARFLIHRRSFRAPTTALNHCVEVVRQQDRERFLCNTCALSSPSKAFLSPTHRSTSLADLLRTRRDRRCSPCTVRDHPQRPRTTATLQLPTSVRLNLIRRKCVSPHGDVCVLPLSPCAAFNIETANIRSTTSTVEIGRMRLMWWRQAIEQGRAGKPPDHPVAQALAQAQAQHSLSFRFLEQLLDAREADLETKQPADLRQLLSYCERTAGALQVGGQTFIPLAPAGAPPQHEHPHLPCASQLLGLECAGVVDNEQAELAAVHVGCALGLATLLRGTAYHASKGCTYIPADVASRHSVDLSQVPH